jgi:hypothetical protein
MIGEPDNQPKGGTDNAQPSTTDTPNDWDYYDPDDEKQDTVTATKSKGTEGETAESAEGTQEAEQSDETEEPESAEDSPEGEKTKALSDEILIPMPDGSRVTLAELKQGNLRQADYTRKSQDIANKRHEIEALATSTHNTMRAVSAFLESTLPARPDPMLAATNPAQFIAMKAQYDSAVERLQYAQQLAQQPQETLNTLSEQQRQELLSAEKLKMVETLPQLGTDKGRKQFKEQAANVFKEAGLPEDMLDTIDDHRLIKVLDYAIKGYAGEQAAKTARAKVAGVPPVTPQKQRTVSMAGAKNREAMAKLSRSGSIKDALLVDF